MEIRYENNRAILRQGAAVFLRRVLLAWMMAAAVESLLVPGDLAELATIAALSPRRMLILTGVILAVLQLIPRDLAYIERWELVLAVGILSVSTLCRSFTWPYLGACLLVMGLLVVYGCRGWQSGPVGSPLRPGESRIWKWSAVAVSVALFLFVSVWTVCRVWSFCAPTYDFTIFAQMFHNMKETGLPVTTVERDGPLSHFAVHVSPIYYLLLPFYCLVPVPATLQVLQAAVLASALIPLWKLGRHHGLAPWQRYLLCLVLAFYPAYSGGTSYDIHENAFLTPLLLWLFYGLDRRSIPTTAVAAVLTWMVKEDAAVYVAVIALWQLLRGLLRRDRRWDLWAGCLLLAGSLVWFWMATGYLSQSGDGVMTYRYGNFMYDGSESLVSVVKAVLLSPMKALYECMDPEKLEYLSLTLLPLLGLPLATRRYERYILLIPYLLVNLMSDYQYQHNIFFQYNFGSIACLFYLTTVNLADLKSRGRGLVIMAVVSLVCFSLHIFPRAVVYPQWCMTYRETYAQRWEMLEQIPAEADVAATTFYTAPLANRETLYDIKYSSKAHVLECEYVVLNTSDTTSFNGYGGREGFLEFLTENGYALLAESEYQLAIYYRDGT